MKYLKRLNLAYKLSNRGMSAVTKLGNKFNGFDLIPDSSSFYDRGAKKVLGTLNTFTSELGQINKLHRKLRKNPKFKNEILTGNYEYGGSWLSKRKAHWNNVNEKANLDVGLKVLNDVLGTRKKHEAILKAPPVINLKDKRPLGFYEKFSAEFELKKLKELEDKVSGHFKRFGKNPPYKRHLGEYKNISRKEVSKSLDAYSFEKERFVIHQPAEMEFYKGNSGTKLRQLKKLRKDFVMNNLESFGYKKPSSVDNITKNKVSILNRLIEGKKSSNSSGMNIKDAKKLRKDTATGRIKFVRIKGRIVPIREK